MRNLKRALSLLLSSTLVLGMLVMGSSAAGYKDVDASNVNQEAIEVLQTVGIMTGDQNGNFNPDGSITRNEMAVVMAHLLKLDYDYFRGTNPFTDVPEWAAPYVAACAANGVVAGIGNGQYGGNNKVTAAEASLMIMKALGYFQNAEDFGSDWQVATVSQASKISLFANINATAESALTRGQVAQLVLNGLKANKVEFTGDKGIQIGNVTVGYRAEYTPVTNAASKYNTIVTGTTTIIGDNGQYYVQLGEELYNGDLKLAGDEADVFGRPARVWSYNGEKIGTYVNYDLMVKEYTTSVTGKELYETVGKTAYDKYDFESYVDGKEDSKVYEDISKDNKGDVYATGNGALTQVFVNSDKEEAVVTVINTYLADADTDYNTKKDEVSFYIHGLGFSREVTGEDFDVADITEGEFVLVNYSYETDAIEVISDVETLSEVTITRFTSDDVGGDKGNTVSSVTVDGTKYNSSEKLTYDVAVLKDYTNSNLKDKTYNVYLDKYGYAIGVEEVDAADNYLFMTGINTGEDYLATANFDANVIFTDGTSGVVKVKSNQAVRDAVAAASSQALINKWFKYTKSTNDVYTLTTIVDDMKMGTDSVAQDRTTKLEMGEINDRHISLIGTIDGKDSRVYGNEDSVYLLADLDVVSVKGTNYGVIAGADEVITGVDNTNIEVMDSQQVADDLSNADKKISVVSGNSVGGTYVLFNDDGVVIAAVVVGENAGVSSNVVYAINSKASEESYENGIWTWTRDVVINGEIVTLTETSDEDESLLADVMKEGNWYTVKYDAEGNVKKVELYDEASQGQKYADDFAEAVQDLRIKDLVVLEMKNETRVDYSKNGRALYDWLDKAKDAGIITVGDVKFVIRQESKNATTTEEYTGWNQLVSALETLNEDPTNLYDFSAVIENGRITSVVIVDDANDDDYQGPDGSNKDPNVIKLSGQNKTGVAGAKVELKSAVTKNTTYEVELQMMNNDGNWRTVDTVKVLVENGNTYGFTPVTGISANQQYRLVYGELTALLSK